MITFYVDLRSEHSISDLVSPRTEDDLQELRTTREILEKFASELRVVRSVSLAARSSVHWF